MKKLLRYICLISLLIAFAALNFGALASCGEKEPEREYLKNETVFKSTSKIDGDTASSIMGIPIGIFAECTAILRPDGTCTLRLEVKDGMGFLINQLGLTSFLSGFDLAAFIEQWVKDYLPGISVADLEGSLNIIEKALGLSVLGVDFDDPNIINLKDSFRDSGKFPADFQIPQGFGIEYNGYYYIERLHSPYTGDYTAVYVDHLNLKGEPFMVFTLLENSDLNKLQFNMCLDLLEISVLTFEV